MRFAGCAVCTFALLSVVPPAGAQTCPLEWKPGQGLRGVGAGTDNKVHDLAVFDDGNGEQLYVAGSFAIAGDRFAAFLARWDGERWDSVPGELGGGFPVVEAVTVYDGELIIGGRFISVDGAPDTNIVARWDGQTWAPLGGGLTYTDGVGEFAGLVHDLFVHDGELIAAGLFDRADGQPVANIARWDGTSWTGVGAGFNNEVWSLGSFQGELVAGGGFTRSGGVTVNRIARFDGTAWTGFGAGVGGDFFPSVYTLAEFDGQLFAGGNFDVIGGRSISAIARWNGTEWETVGGGVGGAFGLPSVESLMVFEGRLIAGGGFTQAGGVPVSFIAAWDGGSWEQVGGGLSGPSFAMTTFQDELVSAGVFTVGGGASLDDGGSTMINIGRWNGDRWRALGGGMDSPVHVWEIFEGRLIAGGQFNDAGSADDVGDIAAWDGAQWEDLAGGVSGFSENINGVFALGVFEDRLYVGGNFLFAGGTEASGVASWDGAAWAPAGDGVDGTPLDMTVYDGALIVGGAFDTAGGLPSRGIARWDGAAWSTLGTGIGGTGDLHVETMTVFEEDLIAAGTFGSVDGVAANNVARFDGANWSAMGDGLENAFVTSLIVYEGELIAGGSLSSGSPVNRWNGASWEPFGDPGFTVQDLIAYRGELYAIGSIVSIQARIARWTGSAWERLEEPAGSFLLRGIPYNGDLVVGGSILTAGEHVSAFWARLGPPCAGDVNGDGLVDLEDLAALLANFGSDVPPGEGGDLNCDGVVTFEDLSTLLSVFGAPCS